MSLTLPNYAKVRSRAMVGIAGAVGILALLGLLALVGWMLMRVPDPKHASMLEMLSAMDHGPEVFVRSSHHA